MLHRYTNRSTLGALELRNAMRTLMLAALLMGCTEDKDTGITIADQRW